MVIKSLLCPPLMQALLLWSLHHMSQRTYPLGNRNNYVGERLWYQSAVVTLARDALQEPDRGTVDGCLMTVICSATNQGQGEATSSHKSPFYRALRSTQWLDSSNNFSFSGSHWDGCKVL
jgi:hypothetical protein